MLFSFISVKIFCIWILYIICYIYSKDFFVLIVIVNGILNWEMQLGSNKCISQPLIFASLVY